jgi:2-C-methyl-D-erythritol 4-phosphate cytidylyltransferase
MDTAHQHGIAIPVINIEQDIANPEIDTIIESGGKMYIVQNPVGIQQSVLKELFEKAADYKSGPINIYLLAEKCGITPVLVENSQDNPRIVFPEDIDKCIEVIKKRSKKYKL